MKRKALVIAFGSVLAAGSLTQVASAAPGVKSMEFIGMDPPATVDEKADIYTKAQVKITYRNGKVEIHDLKYHQLMATTEEVNGKLVGGLLDADGNPLEDDDGPMASDAADGTSLIDIPGMRAADPARNRPLALVTNYEYKELPPNLPGVSQVSHWSKLPALISIAKLDQNKRTGALDAVDYDAVDFSGVNGGWIHCGATLSAWNTHLSSEEYEPDAKTREGLPKATDSDDNTDIASFSKYYFGNEDAANPYHYGLLPEVTVNKRGAASVVKHYAPGRYAREMVELASDGRTAIGGDDGKNTGLFMFVADRTGDLSAGTLYGAKVTQESDESGGTFSLKWIKLGHARDPEIRTMVDEGIKFSDIFDYLPVDTTEDTTGYTKVTTYMGTEWLRPKWDADKGKGKYKGKDKGKSNWDLEKAAAFLETRRYAALLGATTEFSKMEYIAFNKRDRKFYITISRVEAGMSDGKGDIHVARNDGGIILEMSAGAWQRDTNGGYIPSNFVGTRLKSIPELVGGWRTDGSKDPEGNACVQDKLCGPDNLRYVDSIRTLFIGEDTSRRNNNYVWAFNIDTRKLSRILSVPMNAEATGLTAAPNYSGFGYILSNFQHPGEDRGTPFGSDPLANYTGGDKQQVLDALNAKWNNRKKVAIGYIGTETGALPAFD